MFLHPSWSLLVWTHLPNPSTCKFPKIWTVLSIFFSGHCILLIVLSFLRVSLAFLKFLRYWVVLAGLLLTIILPQPPDY